MSQSRAIVPSTTQSLDDHALGTLTGTAVTLSPLKESDAFDIFAYAGHDQIARTVTWEAHRNAAESRRYIRSVCARCSLVEGRTFLAWAARGQREGRVLGHVTFTEQGDIRGQIGYVFHYEHWKRGLPVEALRLAIDAIYSALPRFERIQGLCLPSHVASCELLACMGMAFEGVQRSMLRVRGDVVDLAGYAITRKDWLHRRDAWQSGESDYCGDGHI